MPRFVAGKKKNPPGLGSRGVLLSCDLEEFGGRLEETVKGLAKGRRGLLFKDSEGLAFVVPVPEGEVEEGEFKPFSVRLVEVEDDLAVVLVDRVEGPAFDPSGLFVGDRPNVPEKVANLGGGGGRAHEDNYTGSRYGRQPLGGIFSGFFWWSRGDAGRGSSGPY